MKKISILVMIIAMPCLASIDYFEYSQDELRQVCEEVTSDVQECINYMEMGCNYVNEPFCCRHCDPTIEYCSCYDPF